MVDYESSNNKVKKGIFPGGTYYDGKLLFTRRYAY